MPKKKHKKVKKQRVVAKPVVIEKVVPKEEFFLKRLFSQQAFLFAIFLLGINIAALAFIYLQYQKTVLSFQSSPVTQVELAFRRGEPTQIEVPSQGISIPVIPANIVDGVWETSDTVSTHLATSARPGENGNVVIYGHNRKHIFAPLRKVKVGDVIKVASKEGKTYEYTVSKTEVVKPEHIQAVLPTEHEELTVYTCTGFLDSMRFIVKAVPTQVHSN